jgi:Condensation domain
MALTGSPGLAITLSEIRVGFHGEGAAAGELTWGQMAIWRATQQTGRTMNLVWAMPLPGGTSLAEMTGVLRFVVSRHPALRTRLRFVDRPSGDRHPQQIVAGSGEVPLHIADIGDGDDPAAAAEELRSRYELTWFDYENEFPVRMGVIRQSGALAQMVVGYSHVMVDGAGLGVLTEDLAHLDRITGEATAPAEGLSPLELARAQGSPSGRRQSQRSIQYWAAQLGRLAAWRPGEPARPQEPRFAELVGYSPAMELGMRAVAARTGISTTYVLLAAYSAAAARVFGRNPSVAQIVVSNRFRPGFANLVSQVSQHGICVVDAADAAFDEVVARAERAATSASFFGYYDPVECAALLDEAAARQGQPLDISWCLNDRRGMFGPQDGDGGVPTGAEVTQVLPRTKLYWDRKEPTSDGTLFLQVDSEPLLAGRQALAEGLPAVYLEVWTDTHHFALTQVEAFVREMEAVVVKAASGS